MSRLGNRPHSIGASPPPVPVTLCCGHVPSMACRSEIRACSCVPWLGTATPSRRCRSQTASTPPLFTAKPSERTREPCCDCGFRPDCGPQVHKHPLAGLVRHATLEPKNWQGQRGCCPAQSTTMRFMIVTTPLIDGRAHDRVDILYSSRSGVVAAASRSGNTGLGPVAAARQSSGACPHTQVHSRHGTRASGGAGLSMRRRSDGGML